MTVTRAGLKKGWSEFITNLEPYAATTIQFNRQPSQIGNSEASGQRNIDWVKARVAELTYDLDRIYFNTRHPGRLISASDRFDAVCVVEKTSVNPHVHMAWFQPQEHRPFSKKVDQTLRASCLLETLNSGHRELSLADHRLLEQLQGRRTQFAPDAVKNWKTVGWSVVTNQLFSSGWSVYQVKEQGFRWDFGDQVFIVSGLRGAEQRTKETRFYKIDDGTGAKTLDLDAALVPRK